MKTARRWATFASSKQIGGRRHRYASEAGDRCEAS